MVSFARRLCLALLPVAFGLLTPLSAHAEGPADAAAPKPLAPEEDENLPAYHHSVFSWEHTVTTATVGVGDKPQSYNPTYGMGFVAKTRYYLLDDVRGGRHFSLRLDGGLYTELTNNDATTRRGEWTFSDTSLAGVYVRRFQGKADRDGTSWELRPLTLSLPTAKVSYESGRYFAPGVAVGLINVTPWLRGKVEPDIVSTLRVAVAYERGFARATVPTNPSLERVRLTPDGRTLPGDTVSGAALVRDELGLSGRLRLELGQDVLWTTDAVISHGWKYAVQNDLQVCGVVQTGCTTVELAQGNSRSLVRTQFVTELSVRIAPGFSVELGYGNVTSQLGADGRRRGFFYSPQAIFFTSLSFFPHELAASPKQIAESRQAPSSL